MLNKVCVDLIVPAMEEKYNVFLPVGKKTLEVIYLLAASLNELSDGSFPISKHLSLINASDGAIYDVDNTILENEILNGSRIILV